MTKNTHKRPGFVMDADRATLGGMTVLLDELERRYVFDTKGRITASRYEGVSPRFLLGRSMEGCLWRFRADLGADLVTRIARLAAREPGFPIGGEGPSLAPERLVMIERLFAAVDGENPYAENPYAENHNAMDPQARVEARRSVVTRDGVSVAELFTIE